MGERRPRPPRGGARPRRAGLPAPRKVRRITADLPYTALVALAAPTTTEFPLAPDAGEPFVSSPNPDDDFDAPVARLDAEGTPIPDGRIALVAVPHREGLRALLVIEAEGWSVGTILTSGQLHRLTNALAGRGTRSGVRPESVDGEHVYLTGSPELLVVEHAGHTMRIPAGPKRGLSKALRAFEAEPPLG